MRLLQLSDPHLLADPHGQVRGHRPWPRLQAVLAAAAPLQPDLLLISGDLCQDESWGGYSRLRQLLATWPTPVALLPGNHDHPQLLRAALGRQATLAPALLTLAGAHLLLLSSHRPGCSGGWLGASQLEWVAQCCRHLLGQGDTLPLLVAVHHPPVPIGDPGLDCIRLADADALLPLLQPLPGLRGLVFGHVHQAWQGPLPGRPELPLLGCPSTLCGFGPVQPCPLACPNDPGGLWLELTPERPLHHRLLRWPAPASTAA